MILSQENSGIVDILIQWDREAFVALNNLGIERYDAFWVFVTQIEHWIPLYILMFFLCFKTYQWKKAAFVVGFILLVAVVSISLTDVVKELADRARPNNEPLLEGLIRTLQTPSNFSFWSGHSAVSMAVTTYFVLELKHRFRWVWIFYIWPLLFMLSRIYVGVHYPGDVLVGAGMGTLMGIGIFKLSQLFFKRFLREKVMTEPEIIVDKIEDPEDEASAL